MLWPARLAWDCVRTVASAACDALFGADDLGGYESRTGWHHDRPPR